VLPSNRDSAFQRKDRLKTNSSAVQQFSISQLCH